MQSALNYTCSRICPFCDIAQCIFNIILTLRGVFSALERYFFSVFHGFLWHITSIFGDFCMKIVIHCPVLPSFPYLLLTHASGTVRSTGT